MHLEANQVPAALRGSYTGRKFQAEVCNEVHIPQDAGLWSGGTREVFTAVELATGRTLSPEWQNNFYDGRPHGGITVPMRPGVVVIRHSMFCGKDMGLKFYVHADDTAKLLPAPSAGLSDVEKLVLTATRKFKSSYGGRDRYEMAQSEARWGADAAAFPTRAQWEETKVALVAKGLLDKRGAITVAGRNAVS